MQCACFPPRGGRRGSGCPDQRRARAFRYLFLPLVACLAASPARSAPPPGPNGDALRTTSRGAVHGFVVDAQTHRPVPGARVCIEANGSFASNGSTVALTDANLDANLGGEHVQFLHGGDVLWLSAGQRRRIVDFLGTRSNFLLISFKDTTPATPPQ